MNSKDEEEEEEEEEDGAKEAAAHECEASGGSGDEKERERATPTTRITLTDSYMAIWPWSHPSPPHSPLLSWWCWLAGCAREVRGALLRCVSFFASF